ncbi:type IV pilus biogenesis protein PilM [Methylophilus sp. QUAN]|uniref:type IV pilus biogenesis protein PilM n=1 Tax=Methylophilus sp. QUAN TaxID=2781020 RepID=UPI00188F77C6|nr:type IV pilus biogenesis protein PilM [Methylophilus sp. QUAN]MBF4990970.1 type IV pilus biogenesis protein PilM [Methylophilus sp. QUAN]
MFPTFLVLAFISIATVYSVVEIPKKENETYMVAADVSALNFIAYRSAVSNYLSANPSATGTIADTDLAPYWEPGYIRNANWTNWVNGSLVYVYSTTTLTSGTLNKIFERSNSSALIGTKSPATGRLISANGLDTGIALPAGIPNSALVMMGK